jgi:hypothetical protein
MIKRISEPERRQKYRSLFGTPLGKEILADMALECSFFNDDITAAQPELIGRQNAFKYILRMLTPLNELEEGYARAIRGLTEGILNAPLITQKQEE